MLKAFANLVLVSITAEEIYPSSKMANELLQRFYDEVEANYTIDHTSGFSMDYLHVPFIASVFYIVLVFAGKRFMQNKTAWKLQIPLTLWNASLAAYSALTFAIMFPPLMKDVMAKGFSWSMCNSPCRWSPWLSFWGLTFMLSKIVEFGDTFFVIVRKSPLHFLHWYHHITVLLYTWFSLATRNEAGHWFSSINLGVHSVMYTYYMLKSLKINVPSKVALLITLLQLSQFVLGLGMLLNGTYLYMNNLHCGMRQIHLTTGFIMYGSYFLLFLNFFYWRYIQPKPAKPDKKEQ